mmetsp:Transcript_11825/g.25210  ORF Transcript_11825/g.25210 Transcript_11825/m.25210 type:complete len:517 (+) Transcript_11825:183-1733(+)
MRVFFGGQGSALTLPIILACIILTVISVNVCLIESSPQGDIIQLHRESINRTNPDCAKKLLLSLRKVNGEACNGLLIRDDTILTSSSCSKFNLTFTFRIGEEREAVPHAVLNQNEQIDPRLGFLEVVHPPSQYQFISSGVVQRNRMLLAFNNTGGSMFTGCFKDVPIVQSFQISGDLIPLRHLHQVLPGVLGHHNGRYSDLRYFQQDKDRWWSYTITLEEEKETMIALFEKYKGPRGSVDIVSAWETDPDALLKKTTYVLEAEDPRGHRSYLCHSKYYEQYREEGPFSGENYFDWLDFGSGIRVRNNFNCSMKKTNFLERVYYMNEAEKLQHEVKLEMSNDGTRLIAQYLHSGKLVAKSRPGRHPHVYMWDLNEKMYIVDDVSFEEKYGKLFKHTSILAARPALSAGEIYISEDGVVWGINYESGHYRPQISQTAIMYQWFKKQGINLTTFNSVGRRGWSTKTCQGHDWKSIDITGYDANSLKYACNEITTSPRWISCRACAVRSFNKHLKKLASG